MPEPFQKGNSAEYVREWDRIFKGKESEVDDWERVDEVFCRAVGRMQEGAWDYGTFNPATDKRDLLHEAQEELLDAMNYLGMQYLKLEELKKAKKPENEPNSATIGSKHRKNP